MQAGFFQRALECERDVGVVLVDMRLAPRARRAERIDELLRDDVLTGEVVVEPAQIELVRAIRTESWISLPRPTPSSVHVPSLPIPSTLKIAASSNGEET